MEVAVVSAESIKPCLAVHDLKPFNLCLIDQITPSTYSPIIFFYNTKDISLTTSQITAQLKWSLSKTLNSYYPLSGRVKDNLFVHEFDKGVPCFEARVKGRLSDFLGSPRMEMHDQLLPCKPFCPLPDPTAPQLAVQVNVFDCEGIALGLCFSHKIFDGIASQNFVLSWAANARGSYEKVVEPELVEASTMFPPQNSLPSRYTSTMESMWFSQCRSRTRRFVFDEKAVASLRSKGRSELVQNPTRVEALSAFIWRCAIKALGSPSPRASIVLQAVNIRRLTKPRLSRHSIGNLIWNSTPVYNPDETEMDIKQLVALFRQGVVKIDSKYLKNFVGHKGYKAFLKEVDELAETSKEKEVFNLSSWIGSSDEIDFGWGKPVWVGICGETTRDYTCDLNSIIVKGITEKKNAMEAWITTDDTIMDFLEHDPEFLAFSS